MNSHNHTEYVTAAILFGGIGGESTGLLQSQIEYAGKMYRFNLLCSIDSDPVACLNHDLITGTETAVCMDLFSRKQYEQWHGEEPPTDWKEVTPWDMWVAFNYQVPFFLFSSPPCKGFSALLSTAKSESNKYQALNELTVRGLQMGLQACVTYGDSLPAILQLENVPRITSRGEKHLKKLKRMLENFGYAVSMRADHDLGKIGGLGATRIRFLITARLESAIPNYIYYPVKKPLLTIKDVLGDLPLPGDIEAGGPLHRIPKLKRSSWERLALIPAGGDWRDLSNCDWENFVLIPQHCPTEKTNIANPKLNISSSSSHANIYRMMRWDQSAYCVTGASGANNGALSVADPRLKVRNSRHASVYSISKDDEPAPCVTGTRFGSGAICISDSTTIENITASLSNGHTLATETIPSANDNCVMIIIAEDDTWHRPLTTYEMAILQSFPTHLPDGRPFQLEGCKKDAKIREYIGNAVPPQAAKANGNVLLLAWAQAQEKEYFTLAWDQVWVVPEENIPHPVGYIN